MKTLNWKASNSVFIPWYGIIVIVFYGPIIFVIPCNRKLSTRVSPVLFTVVKTRRFLTSYWCTKNRIKLRKWNTMTSKPFFFLACVNQILLIILIVKLFLEHFVWEMINYFSTRFFFVDRGKSQKLKSVKNSHHIQGNQNILIQNKPKFVYPCRDALRTKHTSPP